MALVTLRVLDGADRGREFVNLSTPVTVGREEGNTVQLNDERVSRYHLKIQEDHNKIVLTDLESTNGTKVNGEDTQLRILRVGDLIHLGRSVLLFGSREEIAAMRAAQQRSADPRSVGSVGHSGVGALDLDFNSPEGYDGQTTLHQLEPPELPDRLSPGQAAQLAEVLEYLHIRIRELVSTVRMEGQGKRVTLDERRWQSLLDIYGRLAEYLRKIGEPRD